MRKSRNGLFVIGFCPVWVIDTHHHRQNGSDSSLFAKTKSMEVETELSALLQEMQPTTDLDSGREVLLEPPDETMVKQTATRDIVSTTLCIK